MAARLLGAFVGMFHVTTAAHLSYTLELREWVVDYQRPTILPRLNPYDIPADAKMDGLFANNSFPGPTVEAYEGDTVDVTVINNMIEDQAAIVWNGVKMHTSPAKPVGQQGFNGTYRFVATTAGSFIWHAELPSQAALGLRGALVVRKKIDPAGGKYKEERMMVLSDARHRPRICIDAKGALVPGCDEIEKVTLNGQWGDGSSKLPKPIVKVEKDECYRLRFLGLMSIEGQYVNITVQSHKMQLLGSTDPPQASIQVHAGEGVDAILCADQPPGIFSHDYTITLDYASGNQANANVKSSSAILRYSTSGNDEYTLEQVPATRPEKQRVLVNKTKKAHEVAEEKAPDFDVTQCEKHVVFDLREHVVDFLRPTVDLGGAAKRLPPAEIPVSNRKAALLINDSYPGPVLEAIEGQLICVTVLNNMKVDPAAIHWHGQHMKGYPAFDGVYGVTQGAIQPQGGSLTYRWKANVGTHFYHAHMQALQADKGLKGPIVIHAKDDPHKHLYDEERVVTLSDEWVNPGACLKAEGAQPGNPVCAEIEKATWNGQWGDGSDSYPWPLVTVDAGKCYRLRFIGMMGQAQNFQISIAGHNMTLIAVDGADVEPVVLSSFNLHAGERADIVVCANQAPGNYLMQGVYDLATFLETAPAPHMPKVDSSKYWAFLHYAGHDEKPGKATKKFLGGYNPPAGTGGGASPQPVAGFAWDTNLAGSWAKVKNLVPEPESEHADATYVFDVGIAHPSFKAGVTPYGHSDKLYMFPNRTSWKKPTSPLLHTKGECGAEGVPYITVPKGVKTVEVIINNLSPTAHVLHMHGMYFSVINYASFGESWCAPARFDCFFLPISVAKTLDCPGARLGDNSSDGPGSQYWGCPYQESDAKTQNLQTPLKKDMISLFRRSWAVIRFKVENPGTWIFHCHMEQHIPTGQIMAFNLLPDDQPPIPSDVPTEGNCPKWSLSAARRPPKRGDWLV